RNVDRNRRRRRGLHRRRRRGLHRRRRRRGRLRRRGGARRDHRGPVVSLSGHLGSAPIVADERRLDDRRLSRVLARRGRLVGDVLERGAVWLGPVQRWSVQRAVGIDVRITPASGRGGLAWRRSGRPGLGAGQALDLAAGLRARLGLGGGRLSLAATLRVAWWGAAAL